MKDCFAHHVKIKYKGNYNLSENLYDELIFMKKDNLEHLEMISIFKISIWHLRNSFKHGQEIYKLILKDYIKMFQKKYALRYDDSKSIGDTLRSK